MAPKVSICIPTYNRSNLLKGVVGTVLAQTFQDYELVIVDDGSSDCTAEVVASFTDGRIRFYRNERNLGLYHNWNRCLELARGDYVAIYHDHDEYARDIVERSVRLLDTHPSVGLVHAGVTQELPGGARPVPMIGNWPEVMPGRRMAEILARRSHSPIHAPTVMVRRRIYEQVGGYRPELGVGSDMEMWVRTALGSDIGYIRRSLVTCTSRSPQDWTGRVRWSDLTGRAEIRRINVRRVWAEAPAEMKRRLWLLDREMEREYLKLLGYVMIKGLDHLAEEGRSIIHAQCSKPVIWAADILCASPTLVRNLGSMLTPMHRLIWAARRTMTRWRSQRAEERGP